MADETSNLLDAPVDGRHETYNSISSVSAAGTQSTEGVEQQVEELSMKSSLKIILPMMVGVLLATMDGTIIIASYAKIGTSFNQLQLTGWIVTSYFLTVASSQSLYGKLSDIFGRKESLLFAFTLFSAGTFCCGLSQNMQQLIASRAIQGIGGGGLVTVITIITTDIVPLRSRGVWQGVTTLVAAAGNALGATIGGLFADTIGWRWSFLLQLPLSIAAIIFFSFALHLPKNESKDYMAKLKRIDFAGAVTLVLTIFFLVFGFDRLGTHSWSDPWILASLAVSFILAWVFLVVEFKFAKEPFVPKRIMFNRSLLLINIGIFFLSLAFLTSFFFLSLYLQATLGLSASQTSIWILLILAGSITGSLLSGFAIKFTETYYNIMVVGLVLHGLGAGLAWVSSGVMVRSSPGLAIGYVVATFGYALTSNAFIVGLVAVAGKDDQAAATSVNFVCRTLGGVCGIGIGGALVQHILRSTLPQLLKGQDVEEIIARVRESLSYIDTLDPNTQEIVRLVYERAIQSVFLFITCSAVLALLFSLPVEEKPLNK